MHLFSMKNTALNEPSLTCIVYFSYFAFLTFMDMAEAAAQPSKVGKINLLENKPHNSKKNKVVLKRKGQNIFEI